MKKHFALHMVIKNLYFGNQSELSNALPSLTHIPSQLPLESEGTTGLSHSAASSKRPGSDT